MSGRKKASSSLSVEREQEQEAAEKEIELFLRKNVNSVVEGVMTRVDRGPSQ